MFLSCETENQQGPGTLPALNLVQIKTPAIAPRVLGAEIGGYRGAGL
jgi:hypothetical protein